MEYKEVLVAKDEGVFEYVGKHSEPYKRTEMSKSDAKYFNIRGLGCMYQVYSEMNMDFDYFLNYPFNIYINETTGDWTLRIDLGGGYAFGEDAVELFYYKKMLFEVRYKIPHRSVKKKNPLVYEYRIISITPLKQREEWKIPEEYWKLKKEQIMDYLPLAPELSQTIDMDEVTQAVCEVFVSREIEKYFESGKRATLTPKESIGTQISYYTKITVSCKKGV